MQLLHWVFHWILEERGAAMTGLLWQMKERTQERSEGGGSIAMDRVTGGIKGHPDIWHGHPLSHHT